MNALIEKAKRKPVHLAAVAALVLLGGAALVGLATGKPDKTGGAAQPKAQPAQVAPVTHAHETEATATGGTEQPTMSATTQAPVAASEAPAFSTGSKYRPAALPLTADLVPGAGVLIYVGEGRDDNRTWIPVGKHEIHEGAPLAVYSADTARTRQGRGWDHKETMRVVRSGLMRIARAGDYTLILDTQADGWRWDAWCSVAVGDPAASVAEHKDTGEDVAAMALAAGWHWLYLTCDAEDRAQAKAQVYVVNVGAAIQNPTSIALHLPAPPQDASAPPMAKEVPAQEVGELDAATHTEEAQPPSTLP